MAAIAYLLLVALVTVCVSEGEAFKGWYWNKTCNSRYCYGFPTRVMRRLYSGLFYTKEELYRRDKLWITQHRRKYGQKGSGNSRLSGDYDQCCPTVIVHHNHTSMVNASGVTKTIVQINDTSLPLFQYIPHAECGTGGACTGSCVIEQVNMDLLVWKMGSRFPFEFNTFLIDAYCSCKS